METLRTRLKIGELASPHHRSRKGRSVDLVVVHSITCPPGTFGTSDIKELFLGTLDCSKHPSYRHVEGKELSAHFLIDRRGRITQFVSTARAAYHAGRSSWQGREACNDFSIGIELEGDAGHAFTGRQYLSLARLCRDLMKAYPAVTPERIVGHSDISPGRKADPGPMFDWTRFRKLLRRV